MDDKLRVLIGGANLSKNVRQNIQKQLLSLKGLRINVDTAALHKKISSDLQNQLEESLTDLNLGQAKTAPSSRINELQNTNSGLGNLDLDKLRSQLLDFINKEKDANELGKSLWDNMGEQAEKLNKWLKNSSMFSFLTSHIKTAVNELQKMDGILTEIGKTSDLTAKQLAELEEASFTTASKYGRLASDYLISVKEMSQAGYDSGSAESMAELSMLAQSAGGMTKELANQYLIASDIAYQYKGDTEKLNALLDGQSQVTRRNVVSMAELADATRIAAGQAKQAGVSEQELTAILSTMISTTHQGGEAAAYAFQNLLMNLQQIPGEIDGEVIDESSFQKVENRLAGLGISISQVVDGSVQLRNPIQILRDLAQVYNTLPENNPDRAGLISDLGGEHFSEQLSGLLSNWGKYEKILKDYEGATGFAAELAMKSSSDWEGSLNTLSNSWASLVQNFANSDTIIHVINLIETLVSALDKLGAGSTMALAGASVALFNFIKHFDQSCNKDYYFA